MGGPWEDYGPKVRGPWEDYAAAKPADSEPSTGAGEAALEHFGNTALAGYLPHAQALAEKVTPNPSGDVDAELRAKGFTVPDSDSSYLESRDANLKRLELEGKEHPYASTAGTVAGLGASLLAPAGAAAKGATLGAKALRGALTGGALGAIQNPGDKEGEIDPLQLGDRTKNAALGSAVGAALPIALKGATTASKRISDFLKHKAEGLAEKAVGATGAQSAKFADDTGRQLLDRKIVKFGSSPSNIAANSNAAMEKSGADIKDVLENQLQGTKVDRKTVLNFIRNKIAGISGDESQSDLVRALKSRTSDIENQITTHKVGSPMPEVAAPDYSSVSAAEMAPMRVNGAPEYTAEQIAQMRGISGPIQEANLSAANKAGYDPYNPLKTVEDSQIPIAQAEDIKRGFQGKVNWNSPAHENDANAIISSGYRQAVEDAATVANPELGAKFRADKETFGLLAPVRDAAERRALQLQQSPTGGLLDMAAAGAGASVGGPIGAVGGLALKQLRPRIPAAAAVTADRLSKGAAALPVSVAKINPQVASYIAQRMGKGAPKFEEDTDSILKNQQLMDIFRQDPSRIDAIRDDKVRNLVRRTLKIPNRKISGE